MYYAKFSPWIFNKSHKIESIYVKKTISCRSKLGGEEKRNSQQGGILCYQTVRIYS